MMTLRHIFSLSSLLVVSAAWAQFDQTITVDGKYVPEVIRLDRINAFHRQERFSLETTPLSYDATGIPASFMPKLYPMAPLGWKDTRTVSDRRGYLDFGMGSWLNSNLSAGYRFIQDSSTTFGVRLQHNSTSLYQPKLSAETADNKQYRYDESIGLYFSRLFEGKGRLEAAADYHYGLFNYYGFNPSFPITEPIPGMKGFYDAPKQNLNDISARIDWHSQSDPDNISWNAGAGVRYFGYDKMYDFVRVTGGVISGEITEVTASRETDVNIAGGVRFPLSSKSAVGIDLDADYILYSGFDEKNDLVDSSSSLFRALGSLKRPDSYLLASLTPYYRFAINRLNLRLGAKIDLSANAGLPDDRYSAFHVAPDMMVDYDGGAARLFLHLLGGSRLHILADNADLDYYQMPFICNTAPVYSPLDGEFGASFGPFSGFSAGIGFAFRVSRGEYTGGWYQDFLNGNLRSGAADQIISSSDPAATNYTSYPSLTYNLHGYSIRANVSYDMGKILKLTASGAYQPQKGETGYFNGYDRPRWVAEISALTNPWNTLRFSIAYRYRGVRNAFITGEFHNDKGFNEPILGVRRLPDVTSLDFGASYSFTDSFSLWLQADNLLNRHIEMLPGLPSQGITFAGGISVLF